MLDSLQHGGTRPDLHDIRDVAAKRDLAHIKNFQKRASKLAPGGATKKYA